MFDRAVGGCKARQDYLRPKGSGRNVIARPLAGDKAGDSLHNIRKQNDLPLEGERLEKIPPDSSSPACRSVPGVMLPNGLIEKLDDMSSL